MMLLYFKKSKLEASIEKVLSSNLSSFYIEKYKELDLVDLDIKNLPFLRRDELESFKVFDRIYVSPSDVRYVAHTSGTSKGLPLLSAFGQIDNFYFEPSLGTGISRALITYPPLNKTFGASFIQQCYQAEKPVTPIFGDYTQLANSAVLAEETQCDAIYATPTIALQLATYIEEYYDLKKIKLLALASEFLTEPIRKRLHDLYPEASVVNLYASSEIGQFIMHTDPMRKDDKTKPFKPILSALTALELIEGELVVTYTENPAFPLLRYKTGDYFSCVSFDPILLKIEGRLGVDVIKVGGFEILASETDTFFDSLSQKVYEYQIHVFANSENGQPALQIECVLDDNIDSGAVVASIQSEFVNNFYLGQKLTIKQAIENDLLEEVSVKVVDKVSVKAEKRKVLVNHD